MNRGIESLTASKNIRIDKAALTPRLNGSRLRVSEMTLLEDERFLVIERTDQATAPYEIDLARATNILGTRWDQVSTSPSLEQTADLAAAGIRPVDKTLRFIVASVAGGPYQPKLAVKCWSG